MCVCVCVCVYVRERERERERERPKHSKRMSDYATATKVFNERKTFGINLVSDFVLGETSSAISHTCSERTCRKQVMTKLVTEGEVFDEVLCGVRRKIDWWTQSLASQLSFSR